MIDTLAIVGVGLLGGSVALAARARGVARHILGVVRSPESQNYVLHQRMVEAVYPEIGPEIATADLIMLCTPVSIIAEQARQLFNLNAGAIISDVGSTKAQIVRHVEEALNHLPRNKFVGGHPLAGSDKSGPEFATEALFLNRLTFLTPTASTDPAATDLLTRFWQQLGARVELLDAETHDRILALTSHLPHVLAFALAGVISPDLVPYAGTGLRDTTRLAGSDPTLWTNILLSNRDHVLTALDRVQGKLHDLHHALMARDEEALTRIFTEARKVRHALGS